MPTYNELKSAAIAAYDAGDDETGNMLADQARDVLEFDELKSAAIAAYDAGDDDTGNRLADQAKGLMAPYEESKLTDIGRGIKAAPVMIAQGLVESGALAADLAFGTEYSRGVSDSFEKFRKDNDLNPRTTGGQITEEIVGFGLGFIPIAGWLGRANQVARGAARTQAKSKFFKAADSFGKSDAGKKLVGTRAGLIGTTALAAGGFEALVTPDGRPTISDSFDSAPEFLKTENTLELGGTDLAKARLKNKGRRAFEGSLASLTFDVGIPVLGAGARAVGSVPGVSEASSLLSRSVLDVFDRATTIAGKAPIIRSVKEPVKEKFAQWFSPTGNAHSRFVEEMFDAEGSMNESKRKAVNLFQNYESATDQLFRVVDLPKMSKRKRKEIGEQFLKAFETGDIEGFAKNFSKRKQEKIKSSVEAMREANLRIQDEIALDLEDSIQRIKARSEYAPSDVKPLEDALKEIRDSHAAGKTYLRRRFAMYDDAENFYNNLDVQSNSPAYKKALDEMKAHIRSSFSGGVKADDLKQILPADYKEALPLFTKPDGTPTGYVDFSKLTDDQIDRFAELRLLRYLKLDVGNGVTPQQALNNRIQALKRANNAQVVMPGQRIQLDDSIFIERVAELDDLGAVRELMGEVRDPKTMFYNTITDTANAYAASRFYKNMADDVAVDANAALRLQAGDKELPGLVRDPVTITAAERFGSARDAFTAARAVLDERMAKGLSEQDAARQLKSFAENVNTAGSGYGGLLFKATVDDTGKEVTDRLTGQAVDETAQLTEGLLQRGYVQLSQVEGDPSVLGPFGAITNMYVSPAAAEALTTPARLQLDDLGAALATGAILKGQAQRMTIVPNLASQIRNIFGNVIALGQGGMLPNRGDVVDAFRVVSANVEGLNDDALDKLTKELGALGVMDTNLVSSALRDFRELSKDLSAGGRLQAGFDGFSRIIPFMRQLESLYGNSDSFFKILGVFAEQGKMATALGKAGVDVGRPKNFNFEAFKDSMMSQGLAKRSRSLALDDSPSNFLLTLAGDTVKDLMPVYSRVGKLVKKIDAVPIFGAFTSFAAENIRNAANTVQRGLTELSFQVDDNLIAAFKGDEAAARAFARQVRGMGSQRLLSYVAIANVSPNAVTKASMLATGTSEEEMAAARVQAADFYSGSDLGVLSNDKRGKMELFNQSYIFPHSFVREPAIAAIREFNQTGELDKTAAAQITNGMWAGLTKLSEPFAGTSLFAERLLDVLPESWIGRGGKTETGAPIYIQGEPVGDQLKKSVVHTLGAYLPGYARLVVEERGGELTFGRAARAALGVPGTRGQQYTNEEEIARIATGFTPIVVNNRTDFTFRGAEYTSLRNPAKGLATRTIKRADATQADVLESWNGYLDNLYRAQSQLYYYVEAAREMKTSEAAIRAQLKQANLGGAELNSIMKGEFWPGLASKEVIKETKREMRNEDKTFLVNQRPWSTLNQMSNDRRREKLSPLNFAEEEAARLETKRLQREAEVNQANSRLARIAAPAIDFFQGEAEPEVAAPIVETPEPQSVLAPAPAPAPLVQESPPRDQGFLAAVMGSNPLDALKNMQIAQRQGPGN